MSNRLLPDVDTAAVINGVVSHQNEVGMAALEPRTNGTGSVTIGGTVANGDVLSLTFTSKLFAGGSRVVTVTAAGGDTPTTLADKLAAAVLADSVLSGLGVIAEADPTAGKVDLIWSGPLSNFVTLSGSSTGAETFGLVQFTGGSGPIIPTDNLRFFFNRQSIVLKYQRRLLLGSDALAALVASGPQPIS